MIRYALLYKDTKSEISYFYNLDDNSVYTDKKQLNSKVIKIFSILGAGVGMLLYVLINLFNIQDISNTNVLLFFVLSISILIGWIISVLCIRNTTKFFVIENKQKMTNEKIKNMYSDNQNFRKKYKQILFCGVILTLIGTLILFLNSINLFELICIFVLWIILSIMFFVYRPICNNKLKKICMYDNERKE